MIHAAYNRAEQLVVAFYNTRGKRPLITFWKDTNQAKRQAMVCVDEIIAELNKTWVPDKDQIKFLLEVRDEIPNVGI